MKSHVSYVLLFHLIAAALVYALIALVLPNALVQIFKYFWLSAALFFDQFGRSAGIHWLAGTAVLIILIRAVFIVLHNQRVVQWNVDAKVAGRWDGRLVPNCPHCGGTMVKRLARQGRLAGKYFWGCRDYPDCKATIDIG